MPTTNKSDKGAAEARVTAVRVKSGSSQFRLVPVKRAAETMTGNPRAGSLRKPRSA